MIEVGTLLADRAQYADATGGVCTFCDQLLVRGERIARLADGRGWCHVQCVNAARDAAAGED